MLVRLFYDYYRDYYISLIIWKFFLTFHKRSRYPSPPYIDDYIKLKFATKFCMIKKSLVVI